MDPASKARAEIVLRYLCVGAQLSGVRFAGSFIILFEHLTRPRPLSYDDIYLNVESRWALFHALPKPLPNNEDSLPELEFDQKLRALAELRGHNITDVTLGGDAPHLIMTFDSEDILFVNGYHAQFECWQLGLSGAQQDWLVVAAPAGQVVTWGRPESL